MVVSSRPAKPTGPLSGACPGPLFPVPANLHAILRETWPPHTFQVRSHPQEEENKK